MEGSGRNTNSIHRSRREWQGTTDGEEKGGGGVHHVQKAKTTLPVREVLRKRYHQWMRWKWGGWVCRGVVGGRVGKMSL